MSSTTLQTNVPAANEPKLKSDGVWTDDAFKALPNIDFIDRTILSLVRNLCKGGFVGVSAIADKLDMARGTISTRITKLQDSGWVKRVMINNRKAQVVMTQKALDLIKLYKDQRKAMKQAREKAKAEDRAILQAQKEADYAAFGNEDQPDPESQPAPEAKPSPEAKPAPEAQPETTQTVKPNKVQLVPEERKQTLINRFKPSWLKGGLSVQSLADNISDYVDFCLIKGAMPSIEGCKNRLEACVMKARKSEVAYLQAMELAEAKQELNAAKIGKMRVTASAYDSENVRIMSGGISYTA